MKVDREKVRAGMEKIKAQRMMLRKLDKPAVRFFDYLVVIDFEATCIGRDNEEFCQEIIQFPAVLVDTKTLTIKDEFCRYVKPVVNPQLSEYCTNLTGITQDLVENAVEFAEALQHFENWMGEHELGTKYKFTIVSDGSYDMGRFLHRQCQLSNIKYPKYAQRWMNIRKSFCLFYHLRWYNLRLMVEMLGEEFQGRPHNGSDDALNIAKIVICLLQDGSEAIENERILLDEEEQRKNATEIANDPRVWYGLSTVRGMTRTEFLNFYKKQHGIPKMCKSAFDNHTTNNYSGKENIDIISMENSTTTTTTTCTSFPCHLPDLLFTPDHFLYSPRITMSSSSHSPSCVHNVVVPAQCSSPGRPCLHCHHQQQQQYLLQPHQLYLPSNIHHFHVGSPPTHLSDHYQTEQLSPPTISRAQRTPPKSSRPPGKLRRAYEAAVATSEQVS